MSTQDSAVSAIVADWSREQPRRLWDPGRRLLRSIRRYQHHSNSSAVWSRYARKFFVLEHAFWSAVTGCEIHLSCEIGGGLLIPHPNGIVIHSDARLGPNCLIFQQVTIGLGRGGVPVIGGHVDIAAGARIVGGISVGDHALIGLNAVVLHSVPRTAVVVGVPGRVIRLDTNRAGISTHG